MGAGLHLYAPILDAGSGPLSESIAFEEKATLYVYSRQSSQRVITINNYL